MEPLKDPDGTRKVKGLPPPPHRPLASNLIFDNNTINWKLIKDFLKK
jgi:serine/threonine-protein phosphatase 2B catalytic subunit